MTLRLYFNRYINYRLKFLEFPEKPPVEPNVLEIEVRLISYEVAAEVIEPFEV